MQKKVGNTSLAYWKIVLLVLLISVYSDGDINILIFHLKKKKKIEKKYTHEIFKTKFFYLRLQI